MQTKTYHLDAIQAARKLSTLPTLKLNSIWTPYKHKVILIFQKDTKSIQLSGKLWISSFKRTWTGHIKQFVKRKQSKKFIDVAARNIISKTSPCRTFEHSICQKLHSPNFVITKQINIGNQNKHNTKQLILRNR